MKRNEIDEQFDQEASRAGRNGRGPIPEGYAYRVFQTCAGLEESSMKINRERRRAPGAGAVRLRPHWRYWLRAESVPTAAAAMSRISGAGNLVEIVTVP